MLIDQIVKYCDDKYRAHTQSGCDNCSYEIYCPKRCDICLHYIHTPTAAPAPRKYDCPIWHIIMLVNTHTNICLNWCMHLHNLEICKIKSIISDVNWLWSKHGLVCIRFFKRRWDLWI